MRRQAAVPTPNARNANGSAAARNGLGVCRTCRSAAVANAVRPCIIHTVSHAFTPATGTQLHQSHGESASCSQFGSGALKHEVAPAGWRGWGASERALRGVGRLQAARWLCMLGPEGGLPNHLRFAGCGGRGESCSVSERANAAGQRASRASKEIGDRLCESRAHEARSKLSLCEWLIGWVPASGLQVAGRWEPRPSRSTGLLVQYGLRSTPTKPLGANMGYA